MDGPCPRGSSVRTVQDSILVVAATPTPVTLLDALLPLPFSRSRSPSPAPRYPNGSLVVRRRRLLPKNFSTRLSDPAPPSSPRLRPGAYGYRRCDWRRTEDEEGRRRTEGGGRWQKGGGRGRRETSHLGFDPPVPLSLLLRGSGPPGIPSVRPWSDPRTAQGCPVPDPPHYCVPFPGGAEVWESCPGPRPLSSLDLPDQGWGGPGRVRGGVVRGDPFVIKISVCVDEEGGRVGA